MLGQTIVGGTSLQLVLRRPDDPTFEVPLGDAPLALGSGGNVDVLVAGAGVATAHVRVSKLEIEAIADVEVGGVCLRAGTRRMCVPSRLRIGSVALTIERAEAAHSIVATKELALRALEAPSLLWPTVLVVEGPARGRELVLQRDGAHGVGRDPQGALAIDDAKMSRAHFEIVVTGGEVFVRDLGSTGGVWLGAARLDQGRKARWPAHRMVLAGQSVFALLAPDALVGGPSPVADGEARAPEPTPPSTSPPPSAAPGAPPGARDDEGASSSA